MKNNLYNQMLEIYKQDIRANYVFPITSIRDGIKQKTIPPKAIIFGAFFAIPLLLCAGISFVLRSICFIFKFVCTYAEVMAETKSSKYWALVALLMPVYILNFILTVISLPFRLAWLWGWGMMLASGFLKKINKALNQYETPPTTTDYYIE